jgi:predicted GH43/DUF377 family glycosyl hydrolase
MHCKKGLSTVITTLIIILLVLVAIGIVWVVIKNILSSGVEQISVNKFLVDLSITKVNVLNGQISITVDRKAGGGKIESLEFNVNNGAETQKFVGEAIDELATKQYTFDYPGLVESVSLVSLVQDNPTSYPTKTTNDFYELTDTELKAEGWVRYSGNPVLRNNTANLWESRIVANPKIVKNLDGSIYNNGGEYWMYYSGGKFDYNASGSPFVSLDQMGVAISYDLFNWTKYIGNPVLRINDTAGSYDHADVQLNTIYFDDDAEVFRAWYASNQINKSEGGDNVTISYAESYDGIHWTKYSGNPILKQGTLGDLGDLYVPCVIKDGDVWKMWYAGHNSTTGGRYAVMYANSSNPQGPWTKYSNNYIFDPGYDIFPSEVWKEGNKYYMLFFDMIGGYEVRFATSNDGINWNNQGIVFSPNPNKSWEDINVYDLSQAFANDRWYTFYTGYGTNKEISIGIATSFFRLPTPVPG